VKCSVRSAAVGLSIVALSAACSGHGDSTAAKHAACVRADKDVRSVGPELEAEADPTQVGQGFVQLAAAVRQDVSPLASSDDVRRYADQMAAMVTQWGASLEAGGSLNGIDTSSFDYLGSKLDAACNG
jgi:hypothetical protein